MCPPMPEVVESVRTRKTLERGLASTCSADNMSAGSTGSTSRMRKWDRSCTAEPSDCVWLLLAEFSSARNLIHDFLSMSSG